MPQENAFSKRGHAAMAVGDPDKNCPWVSSTEPLIFSFRSLSVNNHKTVSNEKDMNNLLKSDELESKLSNINSFLYSLFHIRINKTSYYQLEDFRIIEKSVVSPMTAVDHKYMK